MLDRFDDPAPPRPGEETAARVRRRGLGLRRRRRAFSGTLAVVVGAVMVAGVLRAAGSGAQRVETVQPADAAYCAALAAPLQEPSDGLRFDVIVWVEPRATATRVDSIRSDLEDDARVDRPIDFTDQQEAYEEFERLFPTSPEMLSSVTPEILPYTFRIGVVDGVDPHEVASDYAGDVDVRSVSVPADARALRLADAVLLPFLGDENLRLGPHPQDSFAASEEVWAQVEMLEQAAPPIIEVDVRALAGAIRSDAILSAGGSLSTLDRSLEHAADRVRADAAARCSFEVRMADGGPLPPGT